MARRGHSVLGSPRYVFGSKSVGTSGHLAGAGLTGERSGMLQVGACQARKWRSILMPQPKEATHAAAPPQRRMTRSSINGLRPPSTSPEGSAERRVRRRSRSSLLPWLGTGAGTAIDGVAAPAPSTFEAQELCRQTRRFQRQGSSDHGAECLSMRWQNCTPDTFDDRCGRHTAPRVRDESNGSFAEMRVR